MRTKLLALALVGLCLLAAFMLAGTGVIEGHPGHPQKKLFSARWYQQLQGNDYASWMTLSTSQFWYDCGSSPGDCQSRWLVPGLAAFGDWNTQATTVEMNLMPDQSTLYDINIVFDDYALGDPGLLGIGLPYDSGFNLCLENCTIFYGVAIMGDIPHQGAYGTSTSREATTAHELGHLFNLRHESVNADESVLYPCGVDDTGAIPVSIMSYNCIDPVAVGGSGIYEVQPWDACGVNHAYIDPTIGYAGCGGSGGGGPGGGSSAVWFCNALPSDFSFTDPDLVGSPSCSENLTTSSIADQTVFLDLPTGEPNLSEVITMVPNGVTIGALSAGTKVGGVHSHRTLGLINGACNSLLTVNFVLWNVALPNNPGNPRFSTNIAWPRAPGVVDRFGRWKVGGGTHSSNPPLPADPEWATGSDSPIAPTPTGVNADSISPPIMNYPIYLLDLFDPDFVPGVGDGSAQPIVPQAVYGALTLVAGNWLPLYFAQFGSGQLVGLPPPYGLINANMGQPNVTVTDDPTASIASPSSITDACSPLDVTTMLWGNPGAHPGNPGGVRSINPASAGTYLFSQYSASLRDLDQDSYENALDTCPKNAAPGEDPRTGGGDSNGNGIGNSCDTSGSATDVDGDGFQNRGDNCPQVANPTQEESELGVSPADRGPRTDNIGDACDFGTVNTTQNGHSVTITLSPGVANGRWLTTTSMIPKCVGGTDADSDGYCTSQDPWDSGACTTTIPPSCTVRHGVWSGATHPALQMDTDFDGWSDAIETYMGTDATKSCAQDSAGNNETPLDNWPYDFNDSASATITDVATFASRFGKAVNVSPASTRWDFNSDGAITILDVAKYAVSFGKTCLAAGIPAWSQQ
jgi:hypothetical protein